ncbi:MAG: hypothetical protein A2139_03855 [Desulfobacca sp. RBG_16_60_12]|nr:MAG: hypothetical protein A2139_03855 [Desulfobacca sp. RBG_16_60_12]
MHVRGPHFSRLDQPLGSGGGVRDQSRRPWRGSRAQSPATRTGLARQAALRFFSATVPDAGPDGSPGKLADVSDAGRRTPAALLVYYNRGWTGKKALPEGNPASMAGVGGPGYGGPGGFPGVAQVYPPWGNGALTAEGRNLAADLTIAALGAQPAQGPVNKKLNSGGN